MRGGGVNERRRSEREEEDEKEKWVKTARRLSTTIFHKLKTSV